MTPLFQKLNYKENHAIFAINAPDSFRGELNEASKTARVETKITTKSEVGFVLCFATTKKQVDDGVKAFKHALKGDAIVWMCYPKGTSKKYTCDFNRDTGWEELQKLNYIAVRAVAIDEDWSALRFRNMAFIKKITRKTM